MRKAKVQKPFIHYEPLKPWEIVLIMIYAVITLCIALSRFILGTESRQVAVIFYAMLTQLFLYIFLYVSLRNFRSYLIWLCFGAIHVILYLYFKGDYDLELPNGNASRLLLNTIPLLLLFQFLRFLSRKCQDRDFVAPAKGGVSDFIENTTTDYVLFVLYIASLCGFTFLSVCY
ncbi:hypothetical protein [Mucilaginibacter sp. NFR10]|uniref:hypothetical protein n=1 Tax=unclassified Mucilaginibacter TaxID=2617802 RepID=UPI0008714EB4|nr:hypothetical protein [Mucilaginibacter sp. NFR10]SCW82854.1 hypothetical protein SAMN03159284_04666 [Mucilaginibacter sp. NFR10]